MTTPTHETREGWMQAFVAAAADAFDAAGEGVETYTPIREARIRVSVGFPSAGYRGKVIGECFHASASEDKAREIFIKPTLQSSTEELAGTLTHELVHAVLPDNEGHGRHFGRIARRLGLEGRLTATTVGDDWRQWARPILDALGPFPGADIIGLPVGQKKQKSRQLKLACTECDFICRASAKQIEAHDELICPTQCGGLLERED